MLIRADGHAPAYSIRHVGHVQLISFLLLFLATHVSPDMTHKSFDRGEINLVDSLHLHNTTFTGLIQKPGPHSSQPAALFTGSSRAVYYSSHVRDSITSLLKSSKEFSFLTSIRQQRHNSGTLFAFSDGHLQSSSGRQNVLRIHYSAASSPGVRVESFPVRLADDSWHRLAVIVSGDMVEVMLDCETLHRRVLPGLDTTFTHHPDLGGVTAWLGQRNQDNFLFKGYLQNTKLVRGEHGYLDQCPHVDSTCPTCGQFRQLQDTVGQLQETILELTRRLTMAESRLGELEQCECSRPCTLANSRVKRHDDMWSDGCEVCQCVNGQSQCSPVSCPAAPCAKPDPPPPGQCCQTCKKSCSPLDNQTPAMTHGEVVITAHTGDTCTTCQCEDGFVNCTKVDTARDCPALTCPLQQRVREEGTCCHVCRDLDYCSRGHNCHPDAECKNGYFNFSCHCHQGFQGNGTHCEDVDECLEAGGHHGHHCTLEHGQCVNTPGGYHCDCEPGYRMDTTKTTCQPVDPCAEDSHTCHINATCLTTGPGSYTCRCVERYIGDGHHCQPECDPSCDNGGTCVAPDTCQCPRGFTGTHCQDDVDECEQGEDVHRCVGDSVCVNRVGWHYCSCQDGYTSYYNPVERVTTCEDVDECETGLHTCHQSATCLNNPGGYSCYCDKHRSSCSTDCVVDGAQYSDGSEWVDGCNVCTCSAGRATCKPVTCDCDVAGSDRGCCPQCYDTKTCKHQDIPGLTYSSGQRWVYHCTECECLHGEVDCWPLDCPSESQCPASGLCCALSCDRSCALNTTTGCHHDQQSLIRQESQSVTSPPPGDCSHCQYKNGHIYCTAEHGLACSQPQTNSSSTAGSEMFVEYVHIPESGHDLVTPVSTHRRSKPKVRKHAKRNNPRRPTFEDELLIP